MLPPQEQETPIPDELLHDDPDMQNSALLNPDDNDHNPDANQINQNGQQINDLQDFQGTLPEEHFFPPNTLPIAPNLPNQSHPIHSTLHNLLHPIHEDQQAAHDRRQTYQHITTLDRFHNKMPVREYRGQQRFKQKRSKRRRRKRGRDEDHDIDDEHDPEDDDDYDIWHRPPGDEDANNDGRHQIMMQYANIDGMEPFLELMCGLQSGETECDKLERLMVHKRVTTKGLESVAMDTRC